MRERESERVRESERETDIFIFLLKLSFRLCDFCDACLQKRTKRKAG
uniref:Uncharacterized protein n=1 Tax=Anguilla anguilla TaxID=7936 RepID=A0A0E9UBB9_ANGAN